MNIGHFFPKSGHFFKFFWKRTGETSPPKNKYNWMKISNVVVLTEENIQNMEQGMYWLSEICCCSVFLITLWTKIYAALEEY